MECQKENADATTEVRQLAGERCMVPTAYITSGTELPDQQGR